MIILALETSTPQASLCLFEDDTLLCASSWTAERNHDSYLFPALQQAMDARGNKNLDWILVGSGPGSYGGVRVALAAAVGIAAITHARIVALCSWEAFAHDTAHIVSDARRGGWTLRRPTGEISVISPEELRLLASNKLIQLYTTESAEKMVQTGVTVSKSGLLPTAEALVKIWLNLSEKEREQRASLPVEPIYVRPPHITEAKRKPWEVHN